MYDKGVEATVEEEAENSRFESLESSVPAWCGELRLTGCPTKVKCSIHRALLKIRDLVNLVPSIKYMCCKCGFRGRDLSTGSFALVSSKSGNCRGMQEA